ncbi:glycosyl hydrolase family 18 protein, partial [Francisella philomiragia]|uniref:glycosyl hydrolase family 18 protein n=1 Tax=Francisella philomiragia TaxID=28110 RepID=UPI0021C9AC4A
IDSNSTISADIPKDGTVWKVSIDAIPGFKASISPASFTANNDVQNINVTITENVNNDIIAATYFSTWGGNTSYNVGGKQIVTNPIDINIPNSGDYCAEHNGFCKYNVVIMAFIVTDSSGNMKLSLTDPGSTSQTEGVYTEKQVKDFVNYMKSQGKHVLVSLGGQYFHMDWDNFNGNGKEQIIDIINEYGFDGLDIDLEGSAIPTNAEQLQNAAQGFKDIVNTYRDKGEDFWLTAAPEWGYVVPYTYGTGQWASHSFQSEGYIGLINDIGMDNFTYIWPQTYNQGPSNGITGPGYEKVTPADGMDKFLSAFVWAASSNEGYATNGGAITTNMQIPADKLVLGIPAAEGAAGGELAYVATPEQISNAWQLMANNGISAAGYMDWSADFDAMNIKDGDLSSGYSHAPWSTVEAIVSK